MQKFTISYTMKKRLMNKCKVMFLDGFEIQDLSEKDAQKKVAELRTDPEIKKTSIKVRKQ